MTTVLLSLWINTFYGIYISVNFGLLAFLLFKKPKRIANSLRAPNYSKTSSIQERKKKEKKRKEKFFLAQGRYSTTLSLSLFFFFSLDRHWEKKKKAFYGFFSFFRLLFMWHEKKIQSCKAGEQKKRRKKFYFLASFLPWCCFLVSTFLRRPIDQNKHSFFDNPMKDRWALRT